MGADYSEKILLFSFRSVLVFFFNKEFVSNNSRDSGGVDVSSFFPSSFRVV